VKSGGPAKIRLGSILRARCPACHEGPVLKRVFGIHRRCSVCGHDFHPEPGFYLGAMAISYLLTAMLTIPPMIVLKLTNVDTLVLIAFPLVEFIFLGSFLMVYSRVIWLHLEYRMTSRLDRS
jgi:uncharacterized protein (DUF983 family)